MTSQELLNMIDGLNICVDSRKVESQSDIYVALIGSSQDGHDFIASAIKNGAFAVVCNANSFTKKDEQVHIIEVEDTHSFLITLLNEKYKTNQLNFDLVAITGTNGKTTCTYILEHIYKNLHKNVGVLGTVNYRFSSTQAGDYIESSSLTTPGALDLHTFMAKMQEAQLDIAFMELSSHAIEQNRSAGLEFNAAIFTNLTQDHLDYHKDMESYFSAKAKLFTSLPSLNKLCVINANDPYGQRLLDTNVNFVAYGLDIEPKKYKRSVNAKILENKPSGLLLEIHYQGNQYQLRSPLCGEHNAQNLLAVISYCLYSGLEFQDLLCLENFTGVCGRLEKVNNEQGLNIFVDYAHTPDALINVQKALRAVGFARLITIFGCGGNRDSSKRPLMAEAVAKYADIAILTSDNPREEDPLAIIADVEKGLALAKEKYIEVDRRKSIALGISLLTKDDALLIAGKGHEDYQIIGKTKFPFSDQEEVKKCLRG